MRFIRTYRNSEDRQMSTSMQMMNTEDGAPKALWVSDVFSKWRGRSKLAFPEYNARPTLAQRYYRHCCVQHAAEPV